MTATPQDPRLLARAIAPLCRRLRDVLLASLARAPRPAWPSPDAPDPQLADAVAQTLTLGLLAARAHGVALNAGLAHAARALTSSQPARDATPSTIAATLQLAADVAAHQPALQAALADLARHLDDVDAAAISRADPDAWLYFHEHFLDAHDPSLRRRTGTYYTPRPVVDAMVRLVDETLRARFPGSSGLADPAVTIVDPAAGTGTFLLAALRRISARDRDAAPRLVGLEIQPAPLALAELRLLAERSALALSRASLELRRTDTLAALPDLAGPGRILVVLGNPPYREKARGLGGLIESSGPLADWVPPPDWRVGPHLKHLHNLSIYFWRWATRAVFDAPSPADHGLVCFITVSGLIIGPGFQRMREYLRRMADELLVIHCSPEGHRPEVGTRVFPDVQHEVCIVLASRSPRTSPDTPARVLYRSLPAGARAAKFAALAAISRDDPDWQTCPTDWRAPLRPYTRGAWSSYPSLEQFFNYHGSGVMPGRTWVIAPDPASLQRRWHTLVHAADADKDRLFHNHLRGGLPGDKHARKVVHDGLPGFQGNPTPVADDRAPCPDPIPYAFRSFDRQFIIPDNRLINQPNPTLWSAHSHHQIYLTTIHRTSPESGPAITFTSSIPDMDHYNGRGGRVFPLWSDREATRPNIPAELLALLSRRYENSVAPEDLLAYLAAVAAHPAFTARFRDDLAQPGLRVPLTADPTLFKIAAALGRTILDLHCFTAPPATLVAHEIPDHVDTIAHDPTTRRLHLGTGHIDGVTPEVFNYQVSGKRVVRQFFNYRRHTRERPLIGTRRPPSPLSAIAQGRWLPAYTAELLALLKILDQLVALEPRQRDLLGRICDGPLLAADDLPSPPAAIAAR